MKLDKKGLADIIRAYSEGELDRRNFLKKAVRLGISTAVAGAMATVYGGKVFATSSAMTTAVEKAYDYIIVGSGSAGAALAYRLATRTDASILVLEAGGMDDLPEIHDPALWPEVLSTRATKWYTTTRQPHTANRTHSWPRGNVIGGTSCLNAMIYARGHRQDFDNWAASGCKGWDYFSILKDYKALENWEGGASELRGTGGPLTVTQPQPNLRHPGGDMFIEGSASLGFKPVDDFNGARMEGPAWVNFTIKDSKRQSTSVAFLKPAMSRPNLTVLTDAPVTRVLLEGDRCVGVEYQQHNGAPASIRANKEVILSAGAIDSPLILMHSGIGRSEDLKAVAIKPLIDIRGVGQNLQDHVLGGGPNYESRTALPESNYNASEVYMWAHSDNNLPGPDMATLYLSVPFSTPALPMEGIKNGWSILSGLMRPTSRGDLTLRSSDYREPPVINPNYLATEHDRRVFSQATELARATAMSSAFDSIRAKEWLPGPNVKEGTKAWNEFLQKSVHTFFHPTSTCKMGVAEDAVVDPELKVHGVRNLRVADASVMPEITTGNTNAPSILIGWKCAEMIRGIV